MTNLSRRDFAAISLSTFFAGRVQSVVPHIRADHRADLVIRPFTPDDAEAVGRLVDAQYLNDADRASSLYAINRGLHLPAGRSNDWRATLVAETDGTVIGAGSSRSLPPAPVIKAAVQSSSQVHCARPCRTGLQTRPVARTGLETRPTRACAMNLKTG